MIEQQVFLRAVPTNIEQRSPEVITGRLVPYDSPADVVDPLSTGGFDVYREGFRRSAFDAQVNNARGNPAVLRKISFIHRHEGGLGYLGPITALRSGDDGLYGDMRVLPTKADDVAALLAEGVSELSIEFRLRGQQNTVEEDGVRWRTAVHLDGVALEPQGAFDGAEVLAYRAEMDELQRETAEREAAEAAEQAELEAAAAAEVAAAEEAARIAAAEAAELERTVEEGLARRAKAEEFASRLEAEKQKQRELREQHGLVVPARPGEIDLLRSSWLK